MPRVFAIDRRARTARDRWCRSRGSRPPARGRARLDRGRGLDHRAQGRRSPRLARGKGEQRVGDERPHAAELLQRGDHGDEDAERPARRRQGERLHLIAEDVGVVEQDADPAIAMKRAARRAERAAREELVPAEIEDAEVDRAPGERVVRLAVDPHLLLAGRELLADDEGELGAIEADPLGAVVPRGREIGGHRNVGEHARPARRRRTASGRSRYVACSVRSHAARSTLSRYTASVSARGRRTTLPASPSTIISSPARTGRAGWPPR